MKFYLKFDNDADPSVTVVCSKVTPTIKKIEALCEEFSAEEELLYGYLEDEILPIELSEVTCFYTKEGKVFVSIGEKEYSTKLRIKRILDLIDDSFIKINQGCIANIRQISRFSASFGGALQVHFKNGYSDYVSRRELPNIKRRFGL